MSSHIIHTQKLVLKVSKNKDAFSLQNRVSTLLRDELPNELERLFDRMVPPDQSLRMETLELDLGIIRDEALEEVFKNRLLEKLEQEISREKEDRAGVENQPFLTQQQSLQDALCYFLCNGRLPWYKTASRMAGWEQEMQQAFSAGDWFSLWQWLQQNFQPVIVQRLICQFSDSFLVKLTENRSLKNAPDWPLFQQDVYILVQKCTGLPPAQARYETWVCFLQHLLKNEQHPPWGEIVGSMLFAMLEEQGRRVPNHLSDQEELLSLLKTKTAVDAIERLKTEWYGKPADALREEQKKGKEQADEKKKTPVQTTGEVMYVNNCGVVILHPFLELFFMDLFYYAEGQFLGAEAHQRAVLMLHYLATGQTEAGEYDLTLQKIICGYPLEETLPNRMELSEKEKKESETLLRAVTRHWPPLKNTSAEGLRETFLQREGKLASIDHGWRLTVEQRTVDLLLGKLPWGFSTIRLPWMMTRLSVDWC